MLVILITIEGKHEVQEGGGDKPINAQSVHPVAPQQ